MKPPERNGKAVCGIAIDKPTSSGDDLWRLAWLFIAVSGALLFIRDLLVTRFTGDFSIAGVALWGRDFVNVYTSGTLVLQNKVGILYDVTAYQAFQPELFGAAIEAHNYSYPPVTLLYTWVFAVLPYSVAWLTWLVATGVAFAYAARPYLRDAGLPAWLALAAPASLINVWAGHYGFLIGALWLGAWHVLPRQPLWAGVLFGCMVVKPHLAILAPLVLIARGDWTAFAAAGLTSIGLSVLSLVIFGPELWITYLTHTALHQAQMVDDVGAFFLTMMPTITPALVSLGIPIAAAMAVQLAAGTAAAGLLLRNLPSDSRDAGLATACATFLVLPYAFAYDMTVVGLAGLLLFCRLARAPEAGIRLLGFAWAILPVALMALNPLRMPVAPVLLGLQLLLMLRVSLFQRVQPL